MDRGVSLDVALSLDEYERAGWLVIFGKLRGRKFNWHTGEWEKPDA